MKLPLSWLKEYIPISLSSTEIGSLLTMAGIEVDSIHRIPLSFQGVVVGKVTDVKKHPNAEKLVVATVTDGTEYFQVVCGAPNCHKGMKTAFAKIGATLHDENSQPYKIKKSKLRGVESCGMLCSSKELGFGENHDGIIEFPDKYTEGKDLLDIYSDAILEISLTPNLNHCASILGIARELSALTAHPVHIPSTLPLEDSSLDITREILITIEDKESCPRYACRLIKDVKVGPSPIWMQQRLEACGLRPVNNIVDITNYVLLEYGQPLHAFDYDKLEGRQIIVRKAKEGQSFTTLDHIKRTLTGNTAVICDSSKTLAIAGVMGGLDTEVTSETVNVLIESAYFLPKAIRKSSKEQFLLTEASRRFEKGSDPQQVIPSLEKAAALMQELAEGRVAKGIIDVKQHEFAPKTLTCRLDRINHLLGTQLALGEVETILQRLQCRLSYEGQNVLHVQVPTYRHDLTSEIDLVEEVARIYGYNHIPRSSGKHHTSHIPHAPVFLFEQEIRSKLIIEGLQEFLTCDLINPHHFARINNENITAESIIHVLNPKSLDQSILRPSLLPGLIQLVKHNLNHQQDHIRGFEVGRIHFKNSGQYIEQLMAGIILMGNSQPLHWDQKSPPVDFFDLKGILENLFTAMRLAPIQFSPSSIKTFHPQRQATIQLESLTIGTLGELHPAILRQWDIEQRIYYAEINLNDLFQVKRPESLMNDLPLFPKSERDWTITLKEEVPIKRLMDAIYETHSHNLEKCLLTNIHRSEKVGDGLKNVTVKMIFRDIAKTLSLKEIEAEENRIKTEVLKKLS